MPSIKRDEQYSVKVYLTRDEKFYDFTARVEFYYNPEQYGNGYTMVVISKEEQFGEQGYDIRYDEDFHKDRLIEYIVQFYANRFDGKKTEYDTRWKLIGIEVREVKE